MRPIQFTVHNGDLDELVNRSSQFDKDQSRVFYEAVDKLPEYLKNTFLEDKRARQIGLNMVENNSDFQLTQSNAIYLEKTGITADHLIIIANELLIDYKTQRDTSKGIPGFIYLSRIATSELKSQINEEEIHYIINKNIKIIEKAIKINDFDTAYTGLEVTESFTKILNGYRRKKGDWSEEKSITNLTNELHKSLHIKLYENAAKLLDNEFLTCYNGIIESITEKMKIKFTDRKGYKIYKEFCEQIESKYKEKYKNKKMLNHDFKNMEREKEELLDCMHFDGIYSDIRDKSIKNKDQKYQTFIEKKVNKKVKDMNASALFKNYSPNKIPKFEITRILIGAQSILQEKEGKMKVIFKKNLELVITKLN